jgi:hypothetical protein
MKLTAKVIRVESGSEFIDGEERVMIKVTDADRMYQEFRVRNTDGLKLDNELEIAITQPALAPDYTGVPFLDPAITGESAAVEEVAPHA